MLYPDQFFDRHYLFIYLMSFDPNFSTSRHQNEVKKIWTSELFKLDIYLMSKFGYILTTQSDSNSYLIVPYLISF
jgi:hypothetical protein